MKLLTSTNFHAIQALDFVSDTVGWAIGAVTSEASFLLKTMDGGHIWTQIHYQVKPRQDPGNNYVQYCLQKNLAPIEQNRIR